MRQLLRIGARALTATVVSVLTAASLSAQTTYYVRADGNDANNGRSDNSGGAFRTIEKGLATMAGGDVLVVGNGTYSISDKLRFENKSGTSPRRTVIKSKNRWGAKIRYTDQWGTFEIKNAHYVTVDGFDIGVTDPAAIDHQGTGLVSFDSDYVTFRNNYVHDCGCNGLSFREGDYATIERNVVRDNAKRSRYNCSGVSVYQPEERNQNGGFHIVIRRNVSFENECHLPFDVGAGDFDKPTDGNGIILDDFANKQRGDGDPNKNAAYKQQTLVENNLCFNNGGAGIKVFDIDNATIRNNTTYHNLRILKNYPNPPAEIAVTFSPGLFDVFNNVAVARDDAACKGLEYSDNYGFGYFNRQSNLIVGAVDMVGNTSQWGASNDLVRDRSSQGYAMFADATTSVGSFSSVDDFDRYFRLRSDSPGAESGDGGRAANNDLEGRSRPVDNRVERGCYEGTVSGGSTTTTSDNYVYTDDLQSGWQDWSYGGNVTLRDAGIKHRGSYSAKFQSTESWGALSLRHTGGKSGTDLSSIKLYARKWTDDGSYAARIRVRTSDEAGEKAWRDFTPTNAFQEFTFSRSDLGSPGTVKHIDINVPAGNTLWVDDLRLVYTTTSGREIEVSSTTDAEPLGAEHSGATIAPNPTSGRFAVEVTAPLGVEAVDLTVADVSGRVVESASLPLFEGATRFEVDLSGRALAPGVYVVRLADAASGFRAIERLSIR